MCNNLKTSHSQAPVASPSLDYLRSAFLEQYASKMLRILPAHLPSMRLCLGCASVYGAHRVRLRLPHESPTTWRRRRKRRQLRYQSQRAPSTNTEQRCRGGLMCMERAARSHAAADRKYVMFTVDISSSADCDCPPGRIGPSNQIWYLKPQAVFVAQDAAGWMLRER